MARVSETSCVIVLLCLLGPIEVYSRLDVSLADLLRVPTEFSRQRRLTSGTVANGCSYPGVVGITINNKIVYSGIYDAGTVRLPDDALELLNIANLFNPLIIVGDDGTATASVAAGQLATTSNGDGTFSFSVTSDFSSTSCTSNDAVFYDSGSMTVDVSTCKIVSYGGSQTQLGSFSGTLLETSLVTNTLQTCCQDVLPNILGRSPNLGHPSANALNSDFTCAKCAEGICNGDIGAPIFCTDSTSGGEVVVGMVDSGICAQGETFGVIDLTAGTLTGFSS